MTRLAIFLFGVLVAPVALAQPVLDAEVFLQSPDPDFGGFSAIHVADQGAEFIALSDRGHLLRGLMIRKDGRLIGVETLPMLPILDTKGSPLTGRDSDAEGLAIGLDGTLYFSFESNHRIMRHSSPDSAAEFLPKHPDFRVLQTNSGLEALAIGPDDTIYAIPERSGQLERPYTVYRYQNDMWDTALSIPRQPPYLVVGADVFDGYLYVLERHLGGIIGFSSRIRRFLLADDLASGETLLETRYGRFDNLEGISLWRDTSGIARITLISDDNFRFFQRNQIVEFRLLE